MVQNIQSDANDMATLYLKYHHILSEFKELRFFRIKDANRS